jgi:hypothetical protein
VKRLLQYFKKQLVRRLAIQHIFLKITCAQVVLLDALHVLQG